MISQIAPGEWQLYVEQTLPASQAEVFEFFSDATNLEAITPPWLNFHIASPLPIEMQAGALIDYRLRLHYIPIRWRTEITLWHPPVEFIDEQLRGPYRKWVHHHRFEPCAAGTKVIDTVNYQVWGGRFVNSLVVQRDLEKIFQYRYDTLAALFSERQPVSN